MDKNKIDDSIYDLYDEYCHDGSTAGNLSSALAQLPFPAVLAWERTVAFFHRNLD